MSATEVADPTSPEVVLAGPRTRRRRPPLRVIVAGLVLVVVVAWAIAPSLFTSQSPSAINLVDALQPPSSAHWLGTDELGRDVFARTVYGARTAITGPLIIATVTLLVSTVLALAAGHLGGWTDAVLGRVMDVLYALPPLVVAIVTVGVFGGGYWLAIAVLIVLNLPHNFRLLRAAVVERRNLPYIEAAETLGVSPVRTMFGHLLPNIAPIIAAAFFLRFTYGIVDLSSLSYLGLGAPPGSTDWGRMLAENQVNIFENVWTALAPGLALVLTAVSANVVGEQLYARFERQGRES